MNLETCLNRSCRRYPACPRLDAAVWSSSGRILGCSGYLQPTQPHFSHAQRRAAAQTFTNGSVYSKKVDVFGEEAVMQTLARLGENRAEALSVYRWCETLPFIPVSTKEHQL